MLYPIIFFDMVHTGGGKYDRELRVFSLLDLFPLPFHPNSSSAPMSIATGWLSSKTSSSPKGAAHHTDPKNDEDICRPRIPDPDATLTFNQFEQVVEDVGDERAAELYGEDWPESRRTTMSWTIPAGSGQALGLDPSSASALEGREMYLRTDKDVNGFLRLFWPKGYHESIHTPIIKVIYRRDAPARRVAPADVRSDVAVPATGSDSGSGSGKCGEELSTATRVKLEEEGDDVRKGTDCRVPPCSCRDEGGKGKECCSEIHDDLQAYC